MNKVVYIVLCSIGICVGQGQAQQFTQKPDTVLLFVKHLYENGQYTQAELEARRALAIEALNDSLTIEFERILAFSLVAQGNNQAAIERFEKILMRNENFMLDPVVTSPKILAVFEQAKERFYERRSKFFGSPVSQNSVIQPSVTFRMLVFPGWEQLYQGRTTTGYIFLGAGVTTLGVLLYFSFECSKMRKDYLNAREPQLIEALYSKYNRSYKGRRIAFYTYVVVYIVSEVEVLLSLHKRPTITFNSCLTDPAVRVSIPLLSLR